MIETKEIFINSDCLEQDGIPKIPSGSVNLVLCDLPFEMTKNYWDKIIPTAPMFKEINRVIKENAAVLLMSAGSYTAELIKGNEQFYRYSMVWKTKERRNFLNANRMPLRQHIDIPVFYKKLPVYNPQKTEGHKLVNSYTKHSSDGSNYGKTKIGTSGGGQTDRYPTTIIDIPYKTISIKDRLHSTQKPVELYEWIIKTFSNEGDTVLDFAAGSGTAAIACKNLNRKFICFEKDVEIYKKAYKRVFE
jgi:site-specific DNA-methyltransferase (adenine-specific)